MEFHEKLQLLRKQRGWTQEQLAERLYVSRTAISKWESGRGYPNLESLKEISKVFAITIDELLSHGELMELAETENRSNLERMTGLVFGALDLLTLFLTAIPLLGTGDGVALSVWSLVNHAHSLSLPPVLYGLPMILLAALGLLELPTVLGRRQMLPGGLKIGSLFAAAGALLFYILCRQPYPAMLLFLLLGVKVILLFQTNRK